MRSFHPTLTPITWLRYLWRSLVSTANQPSLPVADTNAVEVVFTDSGRSALAVVVESLQLQNKTIALPAYVCDSLFPILQHYNITPLFLDVSLDTYQPPPAAYTDDVLKRADAVLLVATYGQALDTTVIQLLHRAEIPIIEDWAMRSPSFGKPLQGAARIHSLPKVLPVPDGGVAIVPAGSTVPTPHAHHRSLGFYKNVAKLLPGVAPLLVWLRAKLTSTQTEPGWNGIRKPSTLTTLILADYSTSAAPPTVPFTYCYPLATTDPNQLTTTLTKHGTSSERIWSRPLVLYKEAREAYRLSPEQFPNTVALAQSIVCAPLWHITAPAQYAEYTSKLEHMRTNESR